MLRPQPTTIPKAPAAVRRHTKADCPTRKLAVRPRGPARVGDDNEDQVPVQGVVEEPSQAGSDAGDTSTAPKKDNKTHPQIKINKVWKNYDPQYLGRVTRILPEVATPTVSNKSLSRSQNASESYRQAKEQCERDVQKIIDECTSINQKYTDVHFDLEQDLKVTGARNCIDGLVQDDEDRDQPWDVKRVTDLFENPTFYSDGAGFDDIIQGGLGDCWMMSAFSMLTARPGSIDKVCVARNQDVGVYGFVFFRDGEWHPTIIDDKLYLSNIAFDEGVNTTLAQWGRQQEQKYIELFQRGSKALYFAKCRDDNETWVPLLEKALAKAHGGYDSLRGGQTGEAVEDLTGGVTTEIYTTNILSKDLFWSNDLRKIGKEFMFDATDPVYREWLNWDESENWVSSVRKEHRDGVVQRHAYAVLDTYEGFGERLVKVRNPWGKEEWKGAWSDGSPQWTPQWLERVGHSFSDDGVFWMSYNDFLKTYKHVNRTRIFDDSWYTAQKWAAVQVPFSNIDYQQTKFRIEVPEETETVIVLSQLDTRYFCGLEGQYGYRLQFRISNAEDEKEYMARSRPNYELTRSTNIELKLKKGTYIVLIKIEAIDYGRKTPDEVIKANLPDRKDKVTTIGRLYDLAHAKGQPEPEEPTTQPTSTEEGTQTDESTPGLPTPETTPEPEAAPKASPAAVSPPVPIEPLPSIVPNAETSENEEDDEDDKEPWNASCVVGLRVYSKTPDLGVKVIWPPKPKEEVIIPAPDRDAITKSPQDEAEKNAQDETSAKDEDKKDEVKTDETKVEEAKTEEEKQVAPKKKWKKKKKTKKDKAKDPEKGDEETKEKSTSDPPKPDSSEQTVQPQPPKETSTTESSETSNE